MTTSIKAGQDALTGELAVKLVEATASIKTGQDALSEKVDGLHDRLFGNGQPGDIAKIQMRVESGERYMSEIRGSLKTLKTVGGAIAGAFGLFEALFHALSKR
jgi:hypothetical protein